MIAVSLAWKSFTLPRYLALRISPAGFAITDRHEPGESPTTLWTVRRVDRRAPPSPAARSVVAVTHVVSLLSSSRHVSLTTCFQPPRRPRPQQDAHRLGQRRRPRLHGHRPSPSLRPATSESHGRHPRPPPPMPLPTHFLALATAFAPTPGLLGR